MAHSNGPAALQYPPHQAVSYAQHGAGGQAQPLVPGVQSGGHAGQPMVVLPNGVLIPAELCAIARGNGPAGMAGVPQQIGQQQAGHGQHSQVTPAPRPQKSTAEHPRYPSLPVALPRHPLPATHPNVQPWPWP